MTEEGLIMGGQVTIETPSPCSTARKGGGVLEEKDTAEEQQESRRCRATTTTTAAAAATTTTATAATTRTPRTPREPAFPCGLTQPVQGNPTDGPPAVISSTVYHNSLRDTPNENNKNDLNNKNNKIGSSINAKPLSG